MKISKEKTNILHSRTSKEQGAAQAFANTQWHWIKAFKDQNPAHILQQPAQKSRGEEGISQPPNTTLILLNSSYSTQVQWEQNKMDLFGFTPSKSSGNHNSKQQQG